MIYITGDMHADQARWYYDIHPLMKNGDYLIVAGDFGFGFKNGNIWSDEEILYDWIAQQSYTVLVVDGNHENFNKLMSYPVDSWHGGKVHFVRDNMIHLMRGEVYDIEGKFIFTFGGGYSIDEDRRTEGVSWWPQEMPSDAEYSNAEINLKLHDYSVDYIITHTAPVETVTYLSAFHEYGVSKNVPQEQPLTNFLEHIRETVSYSKWYFGHFHLDKKLWRNQTAIFRAVRELETGIVVNERETGIS